MNHRDSIGVLLRTITSDLAGERPPAAERLEAEDHVSRCSDCWEVLAVLTEAATDDTLHDAAHMRESYGCDSVQDDFWLLDGLHPSEIKAQFPQMARHLSWCQTCRDQYLEIVHVVSEAAAGAYGPPLLARVPAWRKAGAVAGRSLRELAGTITIAIDDGVASFLRVPEGVVLVPATAGANRRRGKETKLVRRIELPLPAQSVSAEILLHDEEGERIGLDLHLAGAKSNRYQVDVRTSADNGLVASKPIVAGEPTTFRELPRGDYIVEIHDRQSEARYRFTLAIQVAS
jgi:hypothetical protein